MWMTSFVRIAVSGLEKVGVCVARDVGQCRDSHMSDRFRREGKGITTTSSCLH